MDDNIITPVSDGVNKLQNAVHHSVSLEVGMGFGFGAEGKAGIINASLIAVPIRNEYIFADDCKTNSTTKFAASVDIGEILGIGAETKCSAYNGQGDGYAWMMPGHEWEYQVGLISKNADWSISNQEEEPNFTLSFGASAYFFIGGDITLSFDVDEFCERLGWK